MKVAGNATFSRPVLELLRIVLLFSILTGSYANVETFTAVCDRLDASNECTVSIDVSELSSKEIMGGRVNTVVQDTDFDDGGSVINYVNDVPISVGSSTACAPAAPSACDDASTPAYQLNKGSNIPTFSCLSDYSLSAAEVAVGTVDFKFLVSDSVNSCNHYSASVTDGTITPFLVTVTVDVYYHDVPAAPTVEFNCGSGGAFNLSVEWPDNNGRPLNSFTVETDSIETDSRVTVAAIGNSLFSTGSSNAFDGASSALVALQRQFYEAVPVVSHSSGAAHTARCPDGMSIAFGFKLQTSTSHGVDDTACMASNSDKCNARTSSCSQEACDTAGDDVMMIYLLCQFHEETASGLSSSSADLLQQADVVASTTGTASCSAGKTILFGFGFQTSTSTSPSDVEADCLSNARVVCEAGATFCTPPTCVTEGDDAPFVVIACSAHSGLEVGSVVMSETGTATCPSSELIAFGMGMNVFAPEVTTTPTAGTVTETSFGVFRSTQASGYGGAIQAQRGVSDAGLAAAGGSTDLTLSYSFTPFAQEGSFSADLSLYGVCSSAADVGVNVVAGPGGFTVRLCDGVAIESLDFATTLEVDVPVHAIVSITLQPSAADALVDERMITVYSSGVQVGASTPSSVNGELYDATAPDAGAGFVFGADSAFALVGVLHDASLRTVAVSSEEASAEFGSWTGAAASFDVSVSTGDAVVAGDALGACETAFPGSVVATEEQVRAAWSQGLYHCDAGAGVSAWVQSGVLGEASMGVAACGGTTSSMSFAEAAAPETVAAAFCYTGATASDAIPLRLAPSTSQGVYESTDSFFNVHCDAAVVDTGDVNVCGGGMVFNTLTDVKFQSLYTAEDLLEAGLRLGSGIGGITLQASEMPTDPLTGFTIRAGFTSTRDDFSDLTFEDSVLTTVYGGPDVTLDSWSFNELARTYTFPIPLVWEDVTSNLVVEVSHGSAAGVSSGGSQVRSTFSLGTPTREARSLFQNPADGAAAALPVVLDLTLVQATGVVDATCIRESFTACTQGASSCELATCAGAAPGILMVTCLPLHGFDGEGGVPVTQVALGGLTPETSQTLRVYASNDVGDGDASTVFTVVTDEASAPGDVQSYTLDPFSGGALTASWSAPYDDGGSDLTGYELLLLQATGESITDLTPVDSGLIVSMSAQDPASLNLATGDLTSVVGAGYTAMIEGVDGQMRGVYEVRNDEFSTNRAAVRLNGYPVGSILIQDLVMGTGAAVTLEAVMEFESLDTSKDSIIFGDRHHALTSLMLRDWWLNWGITLPNYPFHIVATWGEGEDVLPTVYIDGQEVTIDESVYSTPDLALQLDGGATFTTAPLSASATGSASFTLEFWFMLAGADAQANTAAAFTLAEMGGLSVIADPSKGVVEARVAAVTQLFGQDQALTVAGFTGAQTSWVHVTVGHEEFTGVLQLAVNGRVVAVGSTNGYELSLGDVTFNGDASAVPVVDDVRVWSVARSEAEVEMYHQSPIVDPCLYCGEPGLEALHQFDLPVQHLVDGDVLKFTDPCSLNDAGVASGPAGTFAVVPSLEGTSGVLGKIHCESTSREGVMIGDDGVVGYMEVFRVYDRELTGAEVADNKAYFKAILEGTGEPLAAGVDAPGTTADVNQLFASDFEDESTGWSGVWDPAATVPEPEPETFHVCFAGAGAADALGAYVQSATVESDDVPVYVLTDQDTGDELDFVIMREFGVWFLKYTALLPYESLYFSVYPDLESPPAEGWWVSSLGVSFTDLEPAPTLAKQCFQPGDYYSYYDGRSLCGGENVVFGPVNPGQIVLLEPGVDSFDGSNSQISTSADLLLQGQWAGERINIWDAAKNTLVWTSTFTTAATVASFGLTEQGSPVDVLATTATTVGSWSVESPNLYLEFAVQEYLDFNVQGVDFVKQTSGLGLPTARALFLYRHGFNVAEDSGVKGGLSRAFSLPTRVSVVSWFGMTGDFGGGVSGDGCVGINMDGTEMVSVCFTPNGVVLGNDAGATTTPAPFNPLTWYELRVEFDWFLHVASLQLDGISLGSLNFCAGCMYATDVLMYTSAVNGGGWFAELNAYEAAADGLVGAWGFDDMTGVPDAGGVTHAVTDTSGNALHGSLTGTATLRDEEVEERKGARAGRGSVSMGPGEGYVELPYSTRFNSETRAAWVAPFVEGVSDQSILSYGSATALDDSTSFFGLDSTGALIFRETRADGTPILTVTSNVTVPMVAGGDIVAAGGSAAWTHVAVSIEEGVAATLYINGGEVGSADLSGVTLLSAVEVNALSLGAFTSASVPGEAQWTGLVDDVRLFNSGLSGAAVLAVAEEGTLCAFTTTALSVKLPSYLWEAGVRVTSGVSGARGTVGPTFAFDNVLIVGDQSSCQVEDTRDAVVDGFEYVSTVITDAETLTATVAGLSESSTYSVALRALNVNGEGPMTVLSQTTTVATNPQAPEKLYPITVTGGMLELAWDEPADTGGVAITGYEVLECEDAACSVSALVYDGTGNTHTAFVLGYLTASTTYYFKLRAYNELYTFGGTTGVSDYSVVTPVDTGDATAPGPTAAPVLLTRTGGYMSVAWSVPEDSGGIALTDYQVYLNNQTMFDVTGANTLTLDVSDLEPFTRYNFSVEALNAAFFCLQEGERSLYAEFTTTRITVPQASSPPTLLSKTGGSIVVTWTDPVDIGGLAVSGYKVYSRAEGSSDPFVESYDGTGNADPFYTHYGLLAATSYEFKVLSMNFLTYGDQALRFEDATQVGAVSDTELGCYGESFTVESWVYLETVSETSVILKLEETTTGEGMSWAYNLDGTLTFKFMTDSGPVDINPADKFPLTYWTHISVVGDMDGNVFIHYDGVMVSTGDLLTGISSGLCTLTLGSFMTGWVDDVRTWEWERDEYDIRDRMMTRVEDQAAAAASDVLLLLYEFTFDDGATTGFISPSSQLTVNLAAPSLTLDSLASVIESERGHGEVSESVVLTTGATSTPVWADASVFQFVQDAATGGSMTLVWDAPEDTGGVATADLTYTVFRVATSGAVTAVYQGSENTAKITGLLASTTYTHYVVASNGVKASANSVSLVSETDVLSDPDPPTGVTTCISSSVLNDPYTPWCYTSSATCNNLNRIDLPPCLASGGSFGIVWTAPLDTGGSALTHYQIRLTGGTTIFETTLDATETSYQFVGLEPNTEYTYSVAAGRSNNVDGAASVATASTTSQTKPGSPALLAEGAGGTGGQVSLTWETPTLLGGGALTGYKLYELTSTGTLSDCSNVVTTSCVLHTADLPNVNQVDTVYTSSFTSSGRLVAGETFYFAIAAVNEAATGQLTDVLAVTTGAVVNPGAPAAPTYDNSGADDELTVYCAFPDNWGGATDLTLKLYDVSTGEMAGQLGTPVITDDTPEGVSYLYSGLSVGLILEFECEAESTVDTVVYTSARSAVGEARTQTGKAGIIQFVESAMSVSESAGTATVGLERVDGRKDVQIATISLLEASTAGLPDDVKFSGTNDTTITVSFADQVSTGSFVLDIVNDATFESPDEVVRLQVSSTDVDDNGNDVTSTYELEVTIVDDGDAGLVGFEQADMSFGEGVGSIELKLVRSEGSDGEITVTLSTADGTATSDENVDGVVDYEPISEMTVTFGPGDTEKFVSITINDDALFEYVDESFTVVLSVPTDSNAGLTDGLSTTTITIVDNGDVGAPGAPLAPTAGAPTGGAVTISWTQPENTGSRTSTIQSMELHVFQCSGGPSSLIETCTSIYEIEVGLESSWFVAGLTAKLDYKFIVAASNFDFPTTLGTFSPEVDVETTSVTTPTVPQDFKLSHSTGGLIELSWDAPLDIGGTTLDAYTVELVQDGASNEVLFTSLETTFIHYYLVAETEYKYILSATNSAGQGDSTAVLSVSTSAPSRCAEPLNPIEGNIDGYLSTGGAISLFVEAPRDTGGVTVDNYNLYYRELSDAKPASEFIVDNLDQFTVLTVGDITYYETRSEGRLASTQYDFVVQAVTNVTDDYKFSCSATQGINVLNDCKHKVDGVAVDGHAPDTDLAVGDALTVAGELKIVTGLTSTSITMEDVYRGESGLEVEVLQVNYVTEVVPLSTTAATPPAKADAPLVVVENGDPVVTGGLIEISVKDPRDTGGIDITGYDIYLVSAAPGHDVYIAGLSIDGTTCTQDGVVSNAVAQVCQTGLIESSDVKFYVQADLESETEYLFSVVATNIVSDCDSTRAIVYSDYLSQATGVMSRPSVPVQLVSTSATGGSISLSWLRPIDVGGGTIEGYRLYFSDKTDLGPDVGVANLTLIYPDDMSVNGLDLTYELSVNLEASTEYAFYVEARNEIGESDLSPVTLASTTSATTPSPPTGLTKGTVTGGSIQFSWTAPDNTGGVPLTGYKLFRTDPTHGNAVEMNGGVLTTELSFEETGLFASNEYDFRVLAINNVGESVSSAVLTVETAPPSIPGKGTTPVPIDGAATGGALGFTLCPATDLGGVLNSQSGYQLVLDDVIALNISWGGEIVDGVGEEFNTARRLSEGRRQGSRSFGQVEVGVGNGLDFVTFGLDEEGVEIHHAVSVVSNHDFGLFAGPRVVSVRPHVGSVSTYSPSARVAGRRLSDATLSNYDSTEGCVDVEYGGLQPSTTYEFVAHSTNIAGVGEGSDAWGGITTEATPPGSPNAPTSPSQTGGQIVLEWTPPTDIGGSSITGYILEFQPPGSAVWTSLPVTGKSTTYTHTDDTSVDATNPTKLVAGTEYRYRVRAVNTAGEGSVSTEAAHSTTAVTTPGAPTRPVQLTRSKDYLHVDWSEPSDFGGYQELVTYSVYISTVGSDFNGGDFTLVDTTTNTDFKIEGLDPSQYYYVVVTATNDAGEGEPSFERLLYTSATDMRPDAPTLGCVSRDSVELEWTTPGVFVGYTFTNYSLSYSATWTDAAGDPASQEGTVTVAENEFSAVHTIDFGVGGTNMAINYTLSTTQVLDGVGSAGVPSDTTTATLTDQVGLTECVGRINTVTSTYDADVDLTWSLAPDTGNDFARITLTFTEFDLECDNDWVVVREVAKVGGSKTEVFRGGCFRSEFTLVTSARDNTFIVDLHSDGSWQGAGISFTYEADGTGSSSTVCPGEEECSGTRGSCTDFQCTCAATFMGEDCSGQVICTLHPDLCDTPDTVKVVSSAYGSDQEGITGHLGTGKSGGPTPKSLGTISRAVELAQPGDTILVMSASATEKYLGAGNCGTVIDKTVTIISLLGETKTYLTCSPDGTARRLAGDTTPILTVTGPGVQPTLVGFTFQEGNHDQGAGLQVLDGASVLVQNSIFTSNVATGNGGGIFVDASSLTLEGVSVHTNEAGGNGGGVELQSSDLTLTNSEVYSNTATGVGGGVYMTGTSTITGSTGTIRNNIATVNGGGVAGVGTATLTNLAVRENTATADGGGFYFSGDGTVVDLVTVTLNANTADVNGGGLFVDAATSVDVKTSSVTSNSAAVGGGAYLSGGGSSLVLDSGSSIDSNTATVSGGGAALVDASVLTGVSFSLNGAPNGGGLFVSGGTPTITSVTVDGSTASLNGGGLYATAESEVTLVGTVLSSNTATVNGGGMFIGGLAGVAADATSKLQGNDADIGGGVYAENAGAVSGLVIEAGEARLGGGVAMAEGTPSFTDVSMTDCTATENGGGLYLTGGVVATANGVTVTNGASSLNGGGACVEAGSELHGTEGTGGAATFTSCTAVNLGGGVYLAESSSVSFLQISNCEANFGAGVYVLGVDTSLADVELTGNDAVASGGGMYVNGATGMALTRVTGTSNSAVSGGGMYFKSAEATHTGLSFTDNTAESGGNVALESSKLLGVTARRRQLESITAPKAITSPSDILSTLTGGAANAGLTGIGGNVWLVDSELSDMALVDGVMEKGAGVYVGGAGVSVLTNMEISGGSATWGGGIMITDDHTLEVDTVAVFDNQASSQGGGVFLESGVLSHENLDVYENTAGEGGGVAVFNGYILSAGNVDASLLGDGYDGKGVNEANLVSNVRSNKVSGVVVSSTNYFGANVFVESDAVFKIQGLALTGPVAGTAADVPAARAELGGGMYIGEAAKGVVSHCRIANNKVQQRVTGAGSSQGAGVYQAQSSEVVYYYSSIVHNHAIGQDTLGLGGGFAMIGGAGELQAANVTMFKTDVSDNIAETHGGGFYLQNGLLDAQNCAFASNTAQGYVDVQNDGTEVTRPGHGGGLYASDASNVYLTELTVIGNKAHPDSGGGGGLYLLDSDLEVYGGLLSGDRELAGELSGTAGIDDKNAQQGGVLSATGGTCLLEDASIRHGAAVQGGAIHFGSLAIVTMNRVTVSESNAEDFGGAVFVTNDADLTMTDCRLEGNSAFYDGGALYNRGATVRDTGSTWDSNSVDDRGGAIFLDTSAIHFSKECVLSLNTANGFGAAMYVSRGAALDMVDDHFTSNGANVTSEECDGGGGIYVTDTEITLTGVRFSYNRATVGGAINTDRDGLVDLEGCIFDSNSAVSGGGVYATSRSTVNGDSCEFRSNTAEVQGGGMFVDEEAKATLTDADVTLNTAAAGGGVYFMDTATLTLTASRVYNNSASDNGGGLYLDGDVVATVENTVFTSNSAAQRGGGIYSSHVTGVTLGPNLDLVANEAVVGGGIWWWYTRGTAYNNGLELICTACDFVDNVGNDWGTNSMRTKVGWFGQQPVDDLSAIPNIQSGVPIYADTDVGSTVITNSPHILAQDYYFNDALLDSATTCSLDRIAEDQVDMMPIDNGVADVVSDGVVPFLGLIILGAIRTENEYTLEATCSTSIGDVPDVTQLLLIINCDPGSALDASLVCSRCSAGMYSPHGRACITCPAFSDCSVERCSDTDSLNLESGDCGTPVAYGVPLPLTQQGRFLGDIRGSLKDDCDSGGCGSCCYTSGEEPVEGLSSAEKKEWVDAKRRERIYQCILEQGENGLGWGADKTHYCLQRYEVYDCPVLEACNPGVTTDTLNTSCLVGYSDILCSVCQDGYSRATTNLCSECPLRRADGSVETGKLKAMYGVLFTLIFVVVVTVIWLYMRDRHENRMMKHSRARARGRVLERSLASGNPVRRWIHSKRMEISERAEERRRLQTVFGVRRTWYDGITLILRPEKVKILLGFGQIFTTFKESYDILWPASVEEQMDSFASWNLDVVKVAGVDCVVDTNFYDTFLFMIFIVTVTVSLIVGLFMYGTVRYRALLRSIPRGCINCGLPVREQLPTPKRKGMLMRFVADMNKYLRRWIRRKKHEHARKLRARAKAKARRRQEKLGRAPSNANLKRTAGRRNSMEGTVADGPLKRAPSSLGGSSLAGSEQGSVKGLLKGTNSSSSANFRQDSLDSASQEVSSEGGSSMFNSSEGSLKRGESLLQQEMLMRELMYGHDTSELASFGSVHTRCPTSRRVTDRRALRALLRSNLMLWKARIKLRVNFRTYQNKSLKLLFWLLLLSYPPVSAVLLRIFNCEEVGDAWYLAEDYRIECWTATHVGYVTLGVGAVLAFIVGVPFTFWMTLFIARNRGVDERVEMLQTPIYFDKKKKFMGLVKEDYNEQGRRFVEPAPGSELEKTMLIGYFKEHNMRDFKTRNRLGFIYHSYLDQYWWYEIVEMTRKLLLNGCMVFFETGTVRQTLGGVLVCYTALCANLYLQPYVEISDNMVAGVVLFQLFLTLFLGLLMAMEIHKTEGGVTENILAGIIVVTTIFTLCFTLGMIAYEKVMSLRNDRHVIRVAQNTKIRLAVRRVWRRAVFKARIIVRTVRSERGGGGGGDIGQFVPVTDGDVSRIARSNPFFLVESSYDASTTGSSRAAATSKRIKRRDSTERDVNSDERLVGVSFQRMLFSKIEDPVARARLLQRLKQYPPGKPVKLSELKAVADHQLIADCVVEEAALKEAKIKKAQKQRAMMDETARDRVERRLGRSSVDRPHSAEGDGPPVGLQAELATRGAHGLNTAMPVIKPSAPFSPPTASAAPVRTPRAAPSSSNGSGSPPVVKGPPSVDGASAAGSDEVRAQSQLLANEAAEVVRARGSNREMGVVDEKEDDAAEEKDDTPENANGMIVTREFEL